MNDLQISKATQEIIELHNLIIQSARRTVSDAIRIGQIISVEKERLEHGQFLPWLQTLPFDQKTVWTYMRFHRYSDKIGNFPNLSEANKQIESLEAAEKRREDERKQQLIRERIRTGVKPEGWDRSLDYEYNKRIEMGGYARKIASEPSPKTEKTDFKKLEDNMNFISEALSGISENTVARQAFKDRIRISDTGKDDAFIDAIADYLEELENDNRRIEACYNIIKICKGIANELQRE